MGLLRGPFPKGASSRPGHGAQSPWFSPLSPYGSTLTWLDRLPAPPAPFIAFARCTRCVPAAASVSGNVVAALCVSSTYTSSVSYAPLGPPPKNPVAGAVSSSGVFQIRGA